MGRDAMKFSQYKDFGDFCKQNNFSAREGLEFLDAELSKIRSDNKT